ncbi:hypothetical protein E2C01_069525 [Portunus trituberculatus]|uniref:Uncharacterized protein n=1 Tax=Portunus trituberculatus TaxID=210409 RepID=A0A5B7HRS0_PORTR|nr:hypothetical protein [Portunus trituberculatus]
MIGCRQYAEGCADQDEDTIKKEPNHASLHCMKRIGIWILPSERHAVLAALSFLFLTAMLRATAAFMLCIVPVYLLLHLQQYPPFCLLHLNSPVSSLSAVKSYCFPTTDSRTARSHTPCVLYV